MLTRGEIQCTQRKVIPKSKIKECMRCWVEMLDDVPGAVWRREMRIIDIGAYSLISV